MEFFYRSDHVRNVFDHVNRSDLAEGRVLEREREVVEIGDHIRIGIKVPIDPDGARIFFDPAAYVEYPVGEIRSR